MTLDTGYAVRVNINRMFREMPVRLQHLDIELTERCNYGCIHCYINKPIGDREALQHELDTAQVKRILADAAAIGVMTVRLTGGEALVRPDFSEIYLYARGLGMRVLVYTNGSLITPEIAALFARVPPLEKIEITSYGMSPASYEAVTSTRGSFADFRRGLGLLQERHIPFLVKGMLLPPNIDELEEFDAWAKTLPDMVEPPKYTVNVTMRGRRDSEAKNKLIERLRAAPERVLPIATRDRAKYLKEMKSFCARFLGPPGDQLFGCGAGSTNVSVDAYGTLQPCMLLRQPQMGYDLKAGTLTDALTSVFPQLKEMRATNPDYLKRCARCFLKSLCEQCPAMSWMETGTLDTPIEYLCQATHAKAVDLGLLDPDEKGWEVSDWKERIHRMSGTLSQAPHNHPKGEAKL